jgi:hypothetical protein
VTDESKRKWVIAALTIMYIFPYVIAAIALGIAANAYNRAESAQDRLITARNNLCVILNEDRATIVGQLEQEAISITLREFDCEKLALTGELTTKP